METKAQVALSARPLGYYSPADADVRRVMSETGMDWMQARYHLQGRKALESAQRAQNMAVTRAHYERQAELARIVAWQRKACECAEVARFYRDIGSTRDAIREQSTAAYAASVAHALLMREVSQ